MNRVGRRRFESVASYHVSMVDHAMDVSALHASAPHNVVVCHPILRFGIVRFFRSVSGMAGSLQVDGDACRSHGC
ncbi:MAG: hypothetical protein EBZ59_04490 [Planctomycetia bacterium]|nr:hypothetical protein [Planctomycetia bacterium]